MIIPYLWNPKDSLKQQQQRNWKVQLVYHQIESDKEKVSYLNTKTLNNGDGKLHQIISYNKDGEKVSLLEMEYPDAHTEITKLSTRRNQESKDIQRFNQNGLLIESIEQTLFGGFDETKYFYDEQMRLLKIAQKDEDGDQVLETYLYKENQLFKIETVNSDGASLFRGFIYNEKGLKEKMIRMQNDLVNLEVDYIYNEKNQLIKEIHESVNRLKGGKNTLMITAYGYHENGKLKNEKFQGFDSYKGKLKFESEEFYNEAGLLEKVIEEDLITAEKEIYVYEYEFMEKD